MKIKTPVIDKKYSLRTYYFKGNQIYFMYEQYFENEKMINENRYYFDDILIQVLEGADKTKPDKERFEQLLKKMQKSNWKIMKVKYKFDKK